MAKQKAYVLASFSMHVQIGTLESEFHRVLPTMAEKNNFCQHYFGVDFEYVSMEEIVWVVNQEKSVGKSIAHYHKDKISYGRSRKYEVAPLGELTPSERIGFKKEFLHVYKTAKGVENGIAKGRSIGHFYIGDTVFGKKAVWILSEYKREKVEEQIKTRRSGYTPNWLKESSFIDSLHKHSLDRCAIKVGYNTNYNSLMGGFRINNDTCRQTIEGYLFNKFMREMFGGDKKDFPCNSRTDLVREKFNAYDKVKQEFYDKRPVFDHDKLFTKNPRWVDDAIKYISLFEYCDINGLDAELGGLDLRDKKNRISIALRSCVSHFTTQGKSEMVDLTLEEFQQQYPDYEIINLPEEYKK